MLTKSELFYDVIIVGAGPAGCMAALKKPTSMTALLIDARSLPRDIICGGILSLWSMKQLSSFGPPESVFCEPKIIGWRLYDWENKRVGGLRNDFYFNVDRTRFDAWLLEQAAATEGVDIWSKTRFLSARTDSGGEGLRVTLSREGKKISLAARHLIGADGASSTLRRFIGVRPPERWVTVQEKVGSEGSRVKQFMAVLDREVDFYGWVIPKNDELLIGAGFNPDRGKPLSHFQKFRARLTERHGIEGSTIERLRARPAVRLRRPGQVNAGIGNILLAGEAAGLICPWSGEGIAYALYSGAGAGRALGTASPQDAYRKELLRIKPRLLLDIAGRKIMKRPLSRLTAARLVPRATFERIGDHVKNADP